MTHFKIVVCITKILIPCVFLGSILSSCDIGQRSDQQQIPLDSTITIKHHSFEAPHKDYNVTIHKTDAKILQKLKQLSKNAFYVDFDVTNTHIYFLIIREKKGIGSNLKLIKAKLDSLKNFIFKPETALELPN